MRNWQRLHVAIDKLKYLDLVLPCRASALVCLACALLLQCTCATWPRPLQEYVEAIAPLVEPSEAGSAEQAKQLTELVNEILLICVCIKTADISTLRKFHCFCLDSRSPAEAPVRARQRSCC